MLDKLYIAERKNFKMSIGTVDERWQADRCSLAEQVHRKRKEKKNIERFLSICGLSPSKCMACRTCFRQK